MRTFYYPLLTLIILIPSALATEPLKPAEAHTVKIGEHNFTLPKGFTIEKVAGSPQVDRPVNGSFDANGRLYVSDSSGSNDKPTEQLKNPTHRVMRLESSKRDGVFDKSVVFADKLSFLQGTLWYKGSLYVAAPPMILKLTDTDDDGKADKREVWFDGKTLTGCANDLHGPYLGPDDKIYWTKGAFAEQELTLKDGRKSKTRAAHIFRADADGKNIEVVMTGGMDNPVGVAFVKGDVFFSTTFLQHPAAGKRDGIIHATYGAVYGKDHDVLEGHIRTGPKLSEPMTHLGPAAPSGLVAYHGVAFGLEYEDNLFCAQFNMSKVSRHILKPIGATFETIDSDFVVSDNRDFHPTDVVVDRDGSLLILDTGGWYKLCCPSSQLANKQVLGAIYRVRKSKAENGSAPAPIPPKPLALSSRDLQDRAAALRDAVNSRSGDSPANVLAALAQEDNDAVLHEGYTRLLIDLGEIKATRLGLTHKSPRAVRAALVALEQIPDAKLTFAEVKPHLQSQDADLRETAWWIAGRHPEWGKNLAAGFAETMKTKSAVPDRIVKFAGDPDVQSMLARHADSMTALQVMRQAKLKAPPTSWMEGIAEIVMIPDIHSDMGYLSAALATLRSFPATMKHPPGLDDKLLKMAADPQKTAGERLLALLVMRSKALDDSQLKFAIEQLDASKPATLRSDAADVLSNAKLTPTQAQFVAERFANVSLLDLDKLLQIFAKNPDATAGFALLKSLDTPTLRAAVRSEQLKPIFAAHPKTVQTEAAKFFDKLDAELQARRANLDKLLDGTRPGESKRGQVLFNSAKTNCAACHTIGYVGGKLGPDLTRIGAIRTEKDLLESIVLPSASFVRSYEPVQVVRLDGRSHSGILKKDSPDEVAVSVSATEEVWIVRAEIDTLKPGAVSVMPAGLDQQLTKQELADLLAFLKGLK